MKTQILSFILTVGLFSCNSGKIQKTLTQEKKKTDTVLVENRKAENKTKVLISDKTKTMEVDDYPVTDDLFTDNSNNNSSYKKKSGVIFSLDKVWFTNDTLKQTLVFEPYTDYHRLYIYHLFNNDIPNDLIKHMELYFSKSKFDNVFDTATFEQKKTSFSGFVNTAIKINKRYFTTKKGFKLGEKKEKAISVYGNPDKCLTVDNIEKCEWKFEGDYVESEQIHSKAKIKRPFAKDSFGYSVLMYFRNDTLIAMIISNDIP
jgi:hypothetical protein